MATPADPAVELAFEVERFEWTNDERLEISGRWYGLRGHRFMRPTLHVRVGDRRRRRMIAVLDHKPWAPEEDGPWIAAFAWRGPPDGVTAVRLEVAPDVILDLPNPGPAAAGTSLTARARPRREVRRVAAPRRTEAPADETPETPRPEPLPDVSPEPAAAPEPAAPQRAVSPPATPRPAAPRRAVSPPAAPKPADRVASPPAPDIAVLALERRLVEERAARERLTNELAEARRQLETLASHQASAVERSRDVVRLEGALAAALARAEAAERHAGELTQPQAPIVVEPLARRVPRRQGGSQDWSAGARAGAVVVLVVLFVAFVLILSTLL
jgi:hypothetical protein